MRATSRKLLGSTASLTFVKQESAETDDKLRGKQDDRYFNGIVTRVISRGTGARRRITTRSSCGRGSGC